MSEPCSRTAGRSSRRGPRPRTKDERPKTRDQRPETVRVAIALGSNLGNRAGTLRVALASIGAYVHGLRVSSFRQTEPVGMPGSPAPFLNAAAVGETALSAHDLLDRLLDIEQALGRERPHPGASRTLDLDLILYGSAIIEEPPRLIVPHPRFRERRFVLEPLAELAGDWTDPVTRHTVLQLLANLDRRARPPS